MTAQLPVAALCDELARCLTQHPVTLLSAPPGAGKSTYLPLYLLRHSAFADKTILMLEPRRLAAKSVASFLAAQLGESVGQTVGYQIRFEQKQCPTTRLLIVTEGVLIKKIMADAELSAVDILIFDEFHERSLQADLALALALEVQQLNERIKLLLMSATLDGDVLAEKLGAPLLRSEGRSFPVDIYYQVPTDQQVALQCAQMAFSALAKHAGNLLVFLPGQKEIEQCQQQLEAMLQSAQSSQPIQIFALIGSLTLAQQQQAIAAPPPGQRKVVIATNIAETSLTIDGISVVIDSGFARSAVFEPKLGFSKLVTQPISQAAAIQRSGRAGRLMPGICYRLDTVEKWQRRRTHTVPDILQADLLAFRLDIAGWGCQVSDLFWLDKPPAAQLAQAEQCLELLGAFEKNQQLSEFGKRMLALPVEPRLAAMLLSAQALEADGYTGAQALAIYLAAKLEHQRQWSGTDLMQQLQPLQGMAKQQQQQLLQQMAVKVPSQLPFELTPLLLSHAFPDRIALRRGNGYLLANGSGAQLNVDDSLAGADVLVVADLRLWQGQALVSVAVQWSLNELQKHWQDALQWQLLTSFDEQQGKFFAEQQLKLGALVIKRQAAETQVNAAARQQAWLGYIAKKGLRCLPFQAETTQLQHRVLLAGQLQPDANWPDFSDDALRQNAALWLGPYLQDIRNINQLQSLDLMQLLRNQLDYSQQRQLDEWLPASWRSVLGTYVPLIYQADGEVCLEIRLQEMFGQLTTPTIGRGAVAVTITLLSPAKRPLQVTRDLASFWQNAYQDVKKEMKGRYPKHYWPDDPANADPTNKTKKAMQHGSKT